MAPKAALKKVIKAVEPEAPETDLNLDASAVIDKSDELADEPAPPVPSAPIAPAEEKKELSLADKKKAVNTEFAASEKAMVKCRVMENINAFIGKKRWVFTSGQVVTVPGHVYEVLKNAKKAL